MIIATIVIVIIVIIASSVYINAKLESGDLIEWGGKLYTKEQAEEKWPAWGQYIEPKNTPEDTYNGFKNAIERGDIEGALEYIHEKKKQRYTLILNDPELSAGYQTLPEWSEVIFNESENSWRVNTEVYYYFKEDMGDAYDSDVPYEIDFIKNPDGYWKLEGI